MPVPCERASVPVSDPAGAAALVVRQNSIAAAARRVSCRTRPVAWAMQANIRLSQALRLAKCECSALSLPSRVQGSSGARTVAVDEPARLGLPRGAPLLVENIKELVAHAGWNM